jgi:hypothetical protein
MWCVCSLHRRNRQTMRRLRAQQIQAVAPERCATENRRAQAYAAARAASAFFRINRSRAFRRAAFTPSDARGILPAILPLLLYRPPGLLGGRICAQTPNIKPAGETPALRNLSGPARAASVNDVGAAILRRSRTRAASR